MKTEMTAIEMARKFGWAEVTVTLRFDGAYSGHFTVAGRTRIIEGSGHGDAVWVDNLALRFNTVVSVSPVGSDGATVSVYSPHQQAA